VRAVAGRREVPANVNRIAIRLDAERVAALRAALAVGGASLGDGDAVNTFGLVERDGGEPEGESAGREGDGLRLDHVRLRNKNICDRAVPARLPIFAFQAKRHPSLRNGLK